MNVASATHVSYDDAAEQRHLALRSEFLLDPDIVFLNHGAFGACPRPVFEKYQWWQRELERQPVEFLGRRLNGLMETAREGLAEYLNADADELVYFSNVTSALNAVARSLPLEAGDEILTTDHEYGALERTWTFVSEHRGANIVVRDLKLPLGEPEEMVETVWAGRHPTHEGAVPEPRHLADRADLPHRAAHRAGKRARHLDRDRRRPRAEPGASRSARP